MGRLRRAAALPGRALAAIRDNRSAKVAAAILLFLYLVALLAPLIAPYPANEQELTARLLPPAWESAGSWSHPLGTDSLGRDVLSRLMIGAQTTLLAATAVVAIAGAVGISLGLLAGYRGGLFETAVTRLGDVQVAFPGLLLALVVVAATGPGLGVVIVVLSLTSWIVFARVTRAQVLSAKETQYVEAAAVIGAPTRRILFIHILPNLTGALTTVATLEFAHVTLAESSLSFLGLGVQPPGTSWGLDLAIGREHIFDAWWLVVLPGLAIAITVLCAHLLANGLGTGAEVADRRIATDGGSVLGPDPAPAGEARIPGAILEVDNLAVEFATRRGTVEAVRGVSLAIAPGETVGLVGESGSGKSVSAHAILGIVDPPGRVTGGDVRWRGRSLLRGDGAAGQLRSVRGREIGIVFQNPMTSLNPLFTIGAQVRQLLRRHLGMRGKQADARALELLEMVGIASPQRRLRQYPHELSGGMRQRVLIAMALACEPELLIADEPTTALDVSTQAQILELLAEIQTELDLAILMITHDLGVVAELCHRVEVMYAGKLLEGAPVEAFLGRARHPYAAGLMRATASLESDSGELVAIEGSPPDMREPPPGCPFFARCERSVSQCAGTMPPLVEERAGHRIACWNPLPRETRETADV